MILAAFGFLLDTRYASMAKCRHMSVFMLFAYKLTIQHVTTET